MQFSSENKEQYANFGTYLTECLVCMNCGDKFFRNKKENVTFCRSCGSPNVYRFSKGNKEEYPRLVDKKETSNETREQTETTDSNFATYIWGVLLLVLALLCVLAYPSFTLDTKQNVINKLKLKYPSQRKETWYHIFSVLDTKEPTVKSIILLHDKNNWKTAECLSRHLVLIYSNGSKIEKEDVSFESDVSKFQEYGEILEYYRPIVQKHRILVANLNEVPSKAARIFHTLCDEISSDIKPSLFLFTLQYQSQTESLRPLQRATSILKEAWKDLSSNDLFPLLSRVVKNVVEIQQEEKIMC